MGRYVFGPVPSRRLGVSLGVNNVPAKYCSYSCIYCQIGRTNHYEVNRRKFYDPVEVASEVVKVVGKIDFKIDYITFVPDGEPTLDINLGKIIRLIKNEVDIPIAVISNSSLIFMDVVKNDLYYADLVSFKIDSVNERVWRVINRPHGKLYLNDILNGIIDFSKNFNGKLITETMLIKGLNDKEEVLIDNANFIDKINFDKAYISIPIRPPAEKWVEIPSENSIVSAYDIYSKVLGEGKVELLIGFEGEDFRVIDDSVKYILNVTRVHPIRIDYAIKILSKDYSDPMKIINNLISSGEIVLVEHLNHKFLIRRIKG